VHKAVDVTALPHDGTDRPRELWWRRRDKDDDPGTVGSFDAVLICTGFGEEKVIDGWTGVERDSYWHPPKERTAQEVIVVGNGDGGLCELLVCLGLDLDKQREWLLKLDHEERKIRDRFSGLEDRWRFRQDASNALDLSREVTREYFAAIRNLSEEHSNALKAYLKMPLPARVTLLGRTKHLFGLHAFAVNRLSAALLLEPIGGDALDGHYRARLKGNTEVHYLNAEAKIREMDYTPELRAHNVKLELNIEGGPTLQARAQTVVPRGGPTRLTCSWAQMMHGAFKERRSTSQLNLLERSLPQRLLERDCYAAAASERRAWRNELAFSSEFYDSVVQRQFLRALEAEGTPVPRLIALYRGKLRLDIALWGCIRLSYVSLLDGVAFQHMLNASPDVSDEFRAWTEPGRRICIGVNSEMNDWESAFNAWLDKPQFPEASVLAVGGRPVLPNAEDWSLVRPKTGFKWHDVLTALANRFNQAALLRDSFQTLQERLSNARFVPWGGRTASFHPVFSALELQVAHAETSQPAYAEELRQLMCEALGVSSRTDFFARVRNAFPNFDPIGVGDQREALLEVVGWFNSAYHYGIFEKDRMFRGEFMWSPSDSHLATTERHPAQTEDTRVCLACLGAWNGPVFAKKLEALEHDVGRHGQTPSVLKHIASWQEYNCAHNVPPSGVLPWLAPTTLRLSRNGRLFAIDGNSSILSRTELLREDGVA
jgi:hypothetical protein